jgi:hypothetical protein
MVMEITTLEFLHNAYESLKDGDPTLVTGGHAEFFDDGYSISAPYPFEDFSTSPIAKAFITAFKKYRSALNSKENTYSYQQTYVDKHE